MGLSLRNDGSSSLTQNAMPGGKISEETPSEPVPYSEGPIWKKHATRLLEGLHLLREQKAVPQPSTPEAPQIQPKIETQAGAGTGGELKG